MLKAKTWIALVTCLGCLFLAGCDELGKPTMPVKVLMRESFVGEGLVAQFHNESSRKLVVHVHLENTILGEEKDGMLALNPNGMTEIGWMEGWKFIPGETITISHEDFQTQRLIVSN